MGKVKNAVIFAVLMVVVVSMSQAARRSDKIAPDLAEELDARAPESRVIVVYEDGVTESDVAAIQGQGGVVRRALPNGRALAGTMSRRDIEDLARSSRVRSISPDRRVLGTLDVTVPATGAGRRLCPARTRG